MRKNPKPVCDVCNDTHQMYHHGLEDQVPCTRCPTPCRECAAHEGRGAYCAETPCSCACHKKTEPEGGDEQAWIRGNRAAYRELLGKCLAKLHPHQDVQAETLLAEREDALFELRDLCEEAGDLDWDERAHLADIIRKHLGGHIRSGDGAFIVLDRQQWMHIVQLLEQRVEELSAMVAHGAEAGCLPVERGLLQAIRNEARVPEGWSSCLPPRRSPPDVLLASAAMLNSVRDALRPIAEAQERQEGEPATGSKRLERLRHCYTQLGVLAGHLMIEGDGG